MIDISAKQPSLRTATAAAEVTMAAASVAAVREGRVPKGDALEIARVTAVQAVKNTAAIIPYCHPVRITGVRVEFELAETRIRVLVTVRAVDRTGVEVEAMTGAAVAALTLYDMLKMIDDGVAVGSVALVEKRGGKGDHRRAAAGLRAAVLVLSDSAAAGAADDLTGPLIRERLEAEGLAVTEVRVLADDRDGVADRLRAYADDDGLDLVLTTGGTGFGPRDQVPEAMAAVLEREAPGIAEAVRAHGRERTPFAMLSRARAGLRGRTLIVNLPGSPGGVRDALDALFPGLPHACAMLRGEGHADADARRRRP